MGSNLKHGAAGFETGMPVSLGKRAMQTVAKKKRVAMATTTTTKGTPLGMTKWAGSNEGIAPGG